MNRESYNRIAAEWDRARVTFHGREREYVDALLEGLPVPSPILDLGCGTGRPIAEHVLAQGHHVTGVDQASELLAIARARFPQATWIESSIEGFDTAEQYAAVVCWDSLFHVERSLHEDLLAKIGRMLRPGGKVLMTVGGSDHPAFKDTMFGQEFFYDSHPPEIELAILGRLGFQPVIAEFTDLPTPGRDKGRFAILARKA